MRWKHWPYWVRGGLTFLLVYLVYFCISSYLILLRSEGGEAAAFGFLYLLGIPNFPILWIMGILPTLINLSMEKALVITGICGAAQWFVIGVIVFYLYGKIKNRKQLPT